MSNVRVFSRAPDAGSLTAIDGVVWCSVHDGIRVDVVSGGVCDLSGVRGPCEFHAMFFSAPITDLGGQ